MSQQFPIVQPSLSDTLQLLKRDILTTLNCMKIGSIESYDPVEGTASVQILLKRVLPSGDLGEYPLLLDCPVVLLQGGGGALQFPISKGDECLVIFSDRNIDAWFETGSAEPPPDGRCHDLSDGVALVGLNSLSRPPAAVPADTMRLSYGDATIDFSGGNITLKSSLGAEWDLAGATIALKGHAGAQLDLSDVVLLKGNGGTELDLSTTVALKGNSGAELDLSNVVALKASSGGEIDLAAKVTIKNTAKNLAVILDTLMTSLIGATVQGPGTTYPLTAATIALLTTAKADLALLLQ